MHLPAASPTGRPAFPIPSLLCTLHRKARAPFYKSISGKNGPLLETVRFWGVWVAQPVKRLTLHLGSGGDLMVREIEPRVGLCADSLEPAWDSPSSSLSTPPLLILSLSLSLSLSKINE